MVNNILVVGATEICNTVMIIGEAFLSSSSWSNSASIKISAAIPPGCGLKLSSTTFWSFSISRDLASQGSQAAAGHSWAFFLQCGEIKLLWKALHREHPSMPEKSSLSSGDLSPFFIHFISCFDLLRVFLVTLGLFSSAVCRSFPDWYVPALENIFSIFSCYLERPHFKDCPVLSHLPWRWETADCFKFKYTQLQLPGIELCLQHGNFQPSSPLCVTSDPSAVACSYMAAIFKTPGVSNHCLVGITGLLAS